LFRALPAIMTVPAPDAAVNERETAPSGEIGAVKVAFAGVFTVIVPFAALNSKARTVSGHFVDGSGIKIDSACQVSACTTEENDSNSPKTIERVIGLSMSLFPALASNDEHNRS
jgi:hypothetical protein